MAGGFATFSHAASAGGPAGAIAGTCLGAVAEAMQGAFSAYDAQKTIAKLSQLFDDAERNNEPGLAGVIAGCMGKAKNKRAYGVANATIAGQPGVMLVRGVRAVGKAIKGTKGVGRADRTEALYEFATKGNSVQKGIAQEAIHAICAAKFENFMKKSIADAMKS